MDIEHLKAFVGVARCGSFSSAAQSLGLTQSGVSRQIQQVERELGFALINREQRPVTLTPAGMDLLSSAQAAIAELESAVQRIKASANVLTGSILIAASTIPGEFVVPGLLARFTAQHPLVRPNLITTDSAGVVEELLKGGAEVGFVGVDIANSRLRMIPVAEDEIILVVPTSHPFAAKQTIALPELAGQALIEREGGSGTFESLRRLLARRGLRLPDHRVTMVVGSSQAQLAAIEAGVGLGFVSSLALASRPHLRVCGVKVEGVRLRRTLYLAHEEKTLCPVARAFVRFVIQGPVQTESAEAL